MANQILTKTGHLAIVHVTIGGEVVADPGDGTFKPGDFPFIIKNDGNLDAELTVRLADQKPTESYSLKVLANSRYCDELLAEILSGIPESYGLRWGA